MDIRKLLDVIDVVDNSTMPLSESKTVQSSKPRNFVAKNAVKTTSGAGAHRDKKKEQKQGYEKHKGKELAEATGDEKFDVMMQQIKKGTRKQATADRRERERQSREQARAAFGPSPADKLSIRPDKGVSEMDSQGYRGHRGDEDPGKGPEKSVKPTKAKDVAKDAEKELAKAMDREHAKEKQQGAAEEGYGTHPSQRVDPRTGKRYVPPKSPLGKGVAEGSKEKTPGIALSKAYKKDFDDKKPGHNKPETALTGTYSKTGKPGGELKKKGVSEAGYNPLDDERREQRRMDQERAQFKRDELEAELSGEEEYAQSVMRGNWYIRINNRIWKKDGTPVTFVGKESARRVGLSILKKNPNKKIEITNRPIDNNVSEGDINPNFHPQTKDYGRGSDFGDPKEILSDVLQTLERKVEWPLTDVMDYSEVKKLLSPITRAVNNKLISLDDGLDRLDEKSLSQNQQKFMGMVYAAKKGEPAASPKVAKVAKGISKKAARDYAATKHKGLPKRKTEENQGASKKQETEFHTKLDKLVHSTFGKRKGENEGLENPKDNPCWKGYKPVGTKKKNGRTVPNCVPKESIGSKLSEAAAVSPAAAGATAGKMAGRVLPGVGAALGAYDAWDRFKKGDYVGAGLSAGAGLAGLVPGVGTAAATGLVGAQLARDYKKGTGVFSKDETAQSATPSPSAYVIKRGDNLEKIAKANNTTVDALMKANPNITDKNKISAGASLNIPGNTSAPGANIPNPKNQQSAAPAPKTQSAPGANIPNPQPDVSAGGASVTDRKVTQQLPTTTRQGNVTTTTSGSNASGTLKGITQDMIVNHPVYKAEMAKAASKSPQQVDMARQVASMKAKSAILQDPSYLQKYQAPKASPDEEKADW